MDVGIITDEISHDIEFALDVMRGCDVQISEIRSVWEKNVSDLGSDELARLKKILNNAGSSVCAIASPFFKCDLSEELKAERGRLHEAKDLGLNDQMDLLDRCFNAAEVLGTNKIRVFAFWRVGNPTPEIEDRIVEMFQEPIRKARERGMILLLENEHACFLGTGVETARVLEKINAPEVKAVWDPGNALCLNETAFPDGYEALKPWIIHVHAKDAIRLPDDTMKWVKIGDGMVNYKAQVEQLKADGYDGIISLETHYSKDEGGKVAASEESLRELVTLVRGS